MRVPTFIEKQFVDDKGYLTETWRQIMAELLKSMQINLSDEGIMAPQQPTTNITKLNLTDKKGALVYDSDTNELKVNINGTFKKVQVV